MCQLVDKLLSCSWNLTWSPKNCCFGVGLWEFTCSLDRVPEGLGNFHIVFIQYLFHTLCVDEGTLGYAS